VCELCGAIKVDKQIGLEISPEEYVDAMVEVSREIKRVLRPDGIYWLNIGDSYASTGGNSDRSIRDHARPFGDVKNKDLIGIPWMVAFALRADGWYLRSEVIWGKYAPMPESINDRPTGAHERIFLLTKNPQYHFDGYAVEDPAVSPNGSSNGFVRPQRLKFGERGNPEPWNGVGGSRNIRSIWMLGPERSPDFHFATFVSEVPRRCILSSLGLKGVCAQCGAPWRRVTKTEIDDSKPRARVNINEPGQRRGCAQANRRRWSFLWQKGIYGAWQFGLMREAPC
jgi:DNA modification methylase